MLLIGYLLLSSLELDLHLCGLARGLVCWIFQFLVAGAVLVLCLVCLSDTCLLCLASFICSGLHCCFL